MELRYYWSIIRRRIWLIVLIVGIVALYSGYQYYKIHQPNGGLTAYRSDITIRIGLQAPNNSTYNSTNTTPGLTTISDYASTSESLADEFSSDQVIKSTAFDTQVIQQIQADLQKDPLRFGASVDPSTMQDITAIAGAMTTVRSHNLVDVTVNWSTAAGAQAIATAVGEVAVAHSDTYLQYEVRNTSPQINSAEHPVTSAQIFSPASKAALVAGPAGNKPVLLLALIFAGLIIGIALAFLVEYLDDRIRSTQEAVLLLGLPSYGEVPPAPSLGQRTGQPAK